eukprot:SAG22_NODE_9222_length_602_cov_0.789264_1_plen_22_part_01
MAELDFANYWRYSQSYGTEVGS